MSLDFVLPYFPPSLRRWFFEDGVTDLMFNNGRVFVDQRGQILQIQETISEENLRAAIQGIARTKAVNSDISEENPFLDAKLPDGSRVAAIFPPTAANGPVLTIRRFTRWYSTQELREFGAFSPVPTGMGREAMPQGTIEEQVDWALGRGANVLFSGSTSAGKSTMVNAFVQRIASEERWAVLEKPQELGVTHPNVLRLEASEKEAGRAEVTMSQLVKACLRHRPDRIIVGEVRGAEAYDLLQALNTGHEGSLSTIHANSTIDALHRLCDLVLSAHSNLQPEMVAQQVARTFHYVLQMKRQRGVRRVVEWAQVKGYNRHTHAFHVEQLPIQ